jgi:hypothetical protein
VSRKGLRRVSGAGAVLLACTALALSTGVVPSAFALFSGETTNASSVVAGGWTLPPTGLAASVSGYDVALSWTAGTHGVNGERLLGVDNGTTNSCSGVTYAALANMAAATTASYTHVNVGASTANGHYYCYQLLSTSTALTSLTSATGWTAAATVGPIRVGLVTNSVANANGGTSGRVDGGDKIVLTFNQPTNFTASTIKVCAVSGASGGIYLGDGATTCGSSDSYSLGKLTGKTIAATRTFTNVPVSGSGTTTLTITLNTGSGSTATLSGTSAWTFTPAAGILSSATTHQATICSSGSPCTPTTSSSF